MWFPFGCKHHWHNDELRPGSGEPVALRVSLRPDCKKKSFNETSENFVFIDSEYYRGICIIAPREAITVMELKHCCKCNKSKWEKMLWFDIRKAMALLIW